MVFEIECLKIYSLIELYQKNRCSKKDSDDSPEKYIFSWHDEAIVDCFYDDLGGIVTRDNNPKDFQKLYKILLRGKCNIKSGFMLSRHAAEAIYHQAKVCCVEFRYFEERSEIIKSNRHITSNLILKENFILEFGVNYIVIKD